MEVTMTAERKLQRVTVTLMRNKKFALFADLLTVGHVYVDDKLATAKTDGRDEWYGREFVNKLDEKEVAFVRLHETSHKMFRHLTIWAKLYKLDAKLANMACDYVINLMLVELDPAEQFIAMPRDRATGKQIGLLDKKYKGMNAKQVFDSLREEGKDGEGQPGNPDGDGAGMDEHDWDGAKEMTEAESKELARDIEQAIRSGVLNDEKHNGKGAGGLGRDMADMLIPKVDWREVLRDFVKSVCSGRDKSSWARPNRRFLHEDIIMPTMVSEKVGHVVVAVDTSGSIGSAELQEFLSEVQGIAEEVHPEVVDLLYWDGVVAGHETYEGGAVALIASSTKPKGGGGTSPSCVSTYLANKLIKPECIIMLTDGEVGGDWGKDWTAPILWCIVGGNKAVATCGKTIHIEGE